MLPRGALQTGQGGLGLGLGGHCLDLGWCSLEHVRSPLSTLVFPLKMRAVGSRGFRGTEIGEACRPQWHDTCMT